MKGSTNLMKVKNNIKQCKDNHINSLILNKYNNKQDHNSYSYSNNNNLEILEETRLIKVNKFQYIAMIMNILIVKMITEDEDEIIS